MEVMRRSEMRRIGRDAKGHEEDRLVGEERKQGLRHMANAAILTTCGKCVPRQ